MTFTASETAISAMNLERAEGFAQWLAMVDSLHSSNTPKKPLANLGKVLQINLNTQSDAPIVLFNSELNINNNLIYNNSSRLLKMELKDWIKDDAYWPKRLDYITFNSFFEMSYCDKVFALHNQNEKLLTLNKLEGDEYFHHFSLHITCTESFVNFINKFLIKQNEIPLRYDNNLKQFLNQLKYLYIMPHNINSYEQVTQFLKENYTLIHESFLKFALKKPPAINEKISYEEFSSFYRFFYHSRVTTFTDGTITH